MRFLILFLLAFILPGSETIFAGEKSGSTDPADAARIFYSELRRFEVTGLPTGESWPVLAPMMSDELVAALERARAEQDDFIKKFPDEKPPWIEGDLFSSLFEGPKTFTVQAAKVTGDRAEVPVQCVRTEGGDTAKWSDTLVLIKGEKGWVIDDVRYDGEWDFANTGTLKEALAAEE